MDVGVALQAGQGPETVLEVRELTKRDAQAYKEMLTALFTEFPQDGDPAEAASAPLAGYERMIEREVNHGGTYKGLFKDGRLVAFAGLLARHDGARREFFGPSALAEVRDPAVLSRVVAETLRTTERLTGISLVLTEIDPGMKYMRDALIAAGFERYGYITAERIVGGESFDAEFLFWRVRR